MVGFSTAQASPERVTKALFSESVEAKLWNVAARTLRSVRITAKYPRSPELTISSPTRPCSIRNIPTKKAIMSTEPLISGHRDSFLGPCTFCSSGPFVIIEGCLYVNLSTRQDLTHSNSSTYVGGGRPIFIKTHSNAIHMMSGL